jgi:hypothetical protein
MTAFAGNKVSLSDGTELKNAPAFWAAQWD